MRAVKMYNVDVYSFRMGRMSFPPFRSLKVKAANYAQAFAVAKKRVGKTLWGSMQIWLPGTETHQVFKNKH